MKVDDKFSNDFQTDFSTEGVNDIWGSDSGEFNNEAPQQPQEPTADDVWATNQQQNVDNNMSDNDTDNVKSKKKFKIWYIPVGIVVLLILFIAVKLKQAKNNPVDHQTTTGEQEESTGVVSYSYDGYKQLLASGVSSQYGFDYTGKTYPTQTGNSMVYTDIVQIEPLIAQSPWSDLTDDGKKSLLTDILSISKSICESEDFDDSFDTKMIEELNGFSFIDKSMLSVILDMNGRNTVNSDLGTNAEYELAMDMNQVEKIYDNNGSKVVIIDYASEVQSDGTVIFILHTESAGNVEKIPIQVGGKTYELERDGTQDTIVNGYITSYGYSHKLDGIQLGVEYIVGAYTKAVRETYDDIGAIALITTGETYQFKHISSTEVQKTSEEEKPRIEDTTLEGDISEDSQENATSEESTQELFEPKSAKNSDGEKISIEEETEAPNSESGEVNTEETSTEVQQ